MKGNAYRTSLHASGGYLFGLPRPSTAYSLGQGEQTTQRLDHTPPQQRCPTPRAFSHLRPRAAPLPVRRTRRPLRLSSTGRLR